MSTITPQAPSNIETKQKSELNEKKDSFLGWMNGILTFSFLGGTAVRSKYGQKAVKVVKNTKTVKNTAKILKNIKRGKTVATWLSRIIKGVGVAAAPFTGGASLAVGLAAGVALDIVVGEAIDAGITMANGGKILDDSKGDWIKLGDWLGQGMYNMVA